MTAAFGGGRITSDDGVLLLPVAERSLGIGKSLAGLIADPLLVTDSVGDILRLRRLAIVYGDADDLYQLRANSGHKLACGYLSDSGRDPCSQLAISRWEGHYGRIELMASCEANVVFCILGLPGNAALDRLVEPVADDARHDPMSAFAPRPPIPHHTVRRNKNGDATGWNSAYISARAAAL